MRCPSHREVKEKRAEIRCPTRLRIEEQEGGDSLSSTQLMILRRLDIPGTCLRSISGKKGWGLLVVFGVFERVRSASGKTSIHPELFVAATAA